MKTFAALVIVLLFGAGVWRAVRPTAAPKLRAVGVDPGGVRPGSTELHPRPGDSLIAFSSGCFWGSEEAFRKMPGIVATAVGFTGGSSAFPSYEQSHHTGHLETVLVEYDPHHTPLSQLLKTFWTLPRSHSEVPKANAAYHAAIWTYDSDQLALAKASRAELERKLHRRLGVEVLPAKPFYLAKDYHQQYDEKSGQDVCPISSSDP